MWGGIQRQSKVAAADTIVCYEDQLRSAAVCPSLCVTRWVDKTMRDSPYKSVFELSLALKPRRRYCGDNKGGPESPVFLVCDHTKQPNLP